jgi:peptide deformylase
MIEINKDIRFLRKKSKKVTKIDKGIRELVSEMVKVMNENNGIGLAACQIHELKRVVVMKNNDSFITLINPLIIGKSKEKAIMEEGCLSLPGCLIEVERAEKITVNAIDLDENELIIDLEGVDARVIQHEIDHLDGILITDKVSLIQKIKRKFEKKL